MAAPLQRVLALALLVGGALSLPSGAPEDICSDPTMTPAHGGASFQTSKAPYTLGAVKGDKPGQYTVSIKSTGDDKFKGFVIKASDSEGNAVGSFQEDPKYNFLDCDGSPRSAVTHQDSDPKAEVSLKWQAPDDFKGDLEIKATVVKNKDTFWSLEKSVTVA